MKDRRRPSPTSARRTSRIAHGASSPTAPRATSRQGSCSHGVARRGPSCAPCFPRRRARRFHWPARRTATSRCSTRRSPIRPGRASCASCCSLRTRPARVTSYSRSSSPPSRSMARGRCSCTATVVPLASCSSTCRRGPHRIGFLSICRPRISRSCSTSSKCVCAGGRATSNATSRSTWRRPPATRCPSRPALAASASRS